MCTPDPNSLEFLVRQAVTGTGAAVTNINARPPAQPSAPRPSPQCSRRKRLWELDSHAHCPVLGVCVPIGTLRKLVNKAIGGEAMADDYELHCGAVADSKHRGAVAETLQRELDRRYALAVQQAGKLKSTEALAAWWDEALRCQDIAGAFWATLTHPRCTPELAHRVEGQVHMLQHQVGMAVRVDIDRFEALLDENAVLTRELAAAQQRTTRMAEEHQRRNDVLQSMVMQMRGQLMVKDTTIATQQADLQALEAASPGLKRRHELAREVEQLMAQRHDQQRALLQAQQEAERQRRHAEDLAAELQQRDALAHETNAGAASNLPAQLGNQAVLCVGGRPASVPVYRQLIEGTGGRFLHHDGGEEDSDAKLDATLAAADLVICQTGCVSHNAYWRVKDHCKRTGKRCVFVESPSGAGLKRALLMLVPAVSESPPLS
jgi:Uncharacterized protein conserved in bacteria (DUF2325)